MRGLVVTEGVAPHASIAGVAALGDGHLVAAGTGDFPAPGGPIPALVRYDVAGAPDPAFSQDGFAYAGERAAQVGSLLRLPDGRLVVTAVTQPAQGRAALLVLRFRPDGTLDRSFGTRGAAVVHFGSLTVHTAGGAVPRAGEKLVVAATAGPVAALARLDGHGRLDQTFGTGGSFLFPFTDQGVPLVSTVAGIAPAPDDGVLVAGTAGGSPPTDGSTVSPLAAGTQAAPVSPPRGMAVARVTSTGALDTTFAGGGSTVIRPDCPGTTTGLPVPGDTVANALAGDGRGGASLLGTVAFADCAQGSSVLGVALVRPDGSVRATTLAGGGQTALVGRALLRERSGRMIAAGAALPPAGGAPRFLLARFRASGPLDTGVRRAGLITTAFPDASAAVAQALAPGVDGSVVAGGVAQVGGHLRFALARYRSLIADVVAPAGVLVFGGTPLSSARSDGRLAFGLTVDEAVTGSVVVSGRGGRLGTANVRLPRAGARQVTVVLGRGRRRALAGSRPKLTATMTLRDTAGNRTVRHRTVTLR